MKARMGSFLNIVAVLLASAAISIAQTSGSYYNNQSKPAPESVQPGSLNYVEGQVSVGGQVLNAQSVGHLTLQPGESLRTASNGYAEVLLTPGAFLRIGPNSEIQMPSAGLAETRINLVQGEAMIEADQLITGTQLSVGIANTSAEVLKKGLYDFNTNGQVVRVFDGKLKIDSAAKSREIGKDDQVFLANGDNLKKTDFNSSQAKSDPLYVWSEVRSRDEAGQNQYAMQNSYAYVPAGGGWFWDPYANYYGFWPSAYLYSPFGFGFYGGYYPGFYGGYYRGYRGLRYGRPAGVHAYAGGHAFPSGGGFRSASGGFHGGGGGHR